MYGCFLVPPDDDGADLGALFWHKDGYSTACGHGTIALGAWAVESRLGPTPTARRDVVVDVPSGRVTARVTTRAAGGGDLPQRALLRAGPRRARRTARRVAVDVAYGGAIYAGARRHDLGLTVDPAHHLAS